MSPYSACKIPLLSKGRMFEFTCKGVSLCLNFLVLLTKYLWIIYDVIYIKILYNNTSLIEPCTFPDEHKPLY